MGGNGRTGKPFGADIYLSAGKKKVEENIAYLKKKRGESD